MFQNARRLVCSVVADQASNQGREARNLWQDADRKGKASQDHCEGIPCECIEEQHLIEVPMLLVHASPAPHPWISCGVSSCRSDCSGIGEVRKPLYISPT